MDPTLVTKATDYATSQSDRWLFIALLVIGGASIAWMAKWFMAGGTVVGEALTSLSADQTVEWQATNTSGTWVRIR